MAKSFKLTKAQYILTIIRSERKLKPLCETLNLSYKYIYAVSKGNKASQKAKDALSSIIKPSYWDEEADEEFIEIYNTNN